MSFETPRLIARFMREDDIPHIAACRSHPEVALHQLWETYAENDARELIGEMTLKKPGDPGWYQWALERKSDGAYIGDCGLKIDPADQRLGQIGYTIARPFWNSGYGSETAAGLVHFAFDNLADLHRLSADADPRNIASARVLEKAGFRREGIQRQSWWLKGEWTDNALYAILRSDWQKQAAPSRRS